jgi:hypothetical protein
LEFGRITPVMRSRFWKIPAFSILIVYSNSGFKTKKRRQTHTKGGYNRVCQPPLSDPKAAA